MREWLAQMLINKGWQRRYRHLPPDAKPPYPQPDEWTLALSMWMVQTGWTLRHGHLLKGWLRWWLLRGWRLSRDLAALVNRPCRAFKDYIRRKVDV